MITNAKNFILCEVPILFDNHPEGYKRVIFHAKYADTKKFWQYHYPS